MAPGEHMTPDQFRKHGHELIDWIATYMERVEGYPVLSRAKPGEVRAKLPAQAPEEGEPFEAMMGDVENIVLPGITHWQSPSFFAYFPANNSAPSILGELLSAGLGVQGMLWATSPACTELESHVLDWLVELLDLPDAFSSSGPGGGVIQDSASSAALCALLAAREEATDGHSGRAGIDDRMTVYASTEAHSSIEKAVRVAGIGSDNLRLVATDARQRLDRSALEDAIAADRAAGARPCMAVATCGTTSSLAFDPIRAMGEICRAHGLWLHVDAAMAGSAALCSELRGMHHGIELADSYCFNPHKWLLTNFDCDCFYVRDRGALIRALSVLPEYLRNTASDSGAVIDYRDWQVPLGRRFRALKLWFVIRHYGANGLRDLIRGHVRLADELASWIEADDVLELAAPPSLNLVCFRHRDGDERSERLLDELNASGELYLSHTRIGGSYALRMSIGQAMTERAHVDRAWKSIQETARR